MEHYLQQRKEDQRQLIQSLLSSFALLLCAAVQMSKTHNQEWNEQFSQLQVLMLSGIEKPEMIPALRGSFAALLCFCTALILSVILF